MHAAALAFFVATQPAQEEPPALPEAPLSMPDHADAQPEEPAPDNAATTDDARVRAAEHVAQADASFADGDYVAALEALERARGLVDDPEHDFLRGVVLQRMRDCEGATRAFEAFLEQAPSSMDADVARERISACRAPEPPTRLPLTTFEGAPPETLPAPRPVHEGTPTSRWAWTRDVTGGVMFGVGLAGAAVGTGLLVAKDRDTSQPESFADYTRVREREDRLKAAGIATLAVSSAVLTGAIIRYVIVARRGRGSTGAMARR